MEIREFRNSDAAVVSALIKECFNTIDLGGHTEEGKRIQIESNSPEKLLRRAKSTRYFVAIALRGFVFRLTPHNPVGFPSNVSPERELT